MCFFPEFILTEKSHLYCRFGVSRKERAQIFAWVKVSSVKRVLISFDTNMPCRCRTSHSILLFLVRAAMPLAICLKQLANLAIFAGTGTLFKETIRFQSSAMQSKRTF